MVKAGALALVLAIAAAGNAAACAPDTLLNHEPPRAAPKGATVLEIVLREITHSAPLPMARARVLQVVRGAFAARRVNVVLVDPTCAAVLDRGARGFIVGQPHRLPDGPLVFIPITAQP